jgi:hypothetical protein
MHTHTRIELSLPGNEAGARGGTSAVQGKTSSVPLPQDVASKALRRGRLALLLLPGFLLLGVAIRSPRDAYFILWLGAAFQFLACGLAYLNSRGLRNPIGSALIMLYVIAISWVLIGANGVADWFVYLSQALLLLIPLGVFAGQCLRESGAPAMRRARHLAQRLLQRYKWPRDLQACRLLPEVKALRQALYVDASPALELLGDPRPQVQVAALAALEYRREYKPGQERVILGLAQRSEDPAVRAVALLALANVEDQITVEALAEFLSDPSQLVRQTATEALLWHTEEVWSWIRNTVRCSLGDPITQEDGPLKPPGNLFPPEAVVDLTSWATEMGLVGMRASQTLGLHYGQLLVSGSENDLVDMLCHQLVEPRTPTLLRLEYAHLLRHHQALDPETLQQVISAATPAPIRLIAAEVLLNCGRSREAVAALHDLARLPNREIALATAEVVQKRLGVNLGLPTNQPPPPLHTRQASEIARRLLAWAAQQTNLQRETRTSQTVVSSRAAHPPASAESSWGGPSSWEGTPASFSEEP